MAEAEKSSEILNGMTQPLGESSQPRSPLQGGSAGLLKDFSLQKFIAATIDVLTPELLQRRKGPTKRPGPTAWLDGLRGVAAFCVCLMHLLTYTHDGIELCYGALYYWGVFNLSPLSLPFLRVIFVGGHFAVMLFFLISGYVLPGRLIRMLHEGRTEDFVETCNSNIIRRPIRLYWPVLVSSLAFAMAWHVFNIEIPWPDRQSNIFYEFIHWIVESAKFCFFFRRDNLFTSYNIHTWTIPVELQGSFCLFFFLFATHQVSTRSRVIITALVIMYLCFGAAGAWYAGFFAGMLTVELDMIYSEGSTSQVKLPWDFVIFWLRRNPIFKMLLLHAMLVFGLFLGGMPSGENMKIMDVLGKCPGWKNLGYLIPPAYDDGKTSYRWFWLFWGAWILLVAIKEIRWAKWLFETNVSQYLGRHSFSLYLIHGPMIGILSERLFYLTGVKRPVDLTTYMRFAHLTGKWQEASWFPFSEKPLWGMYGLEPNFLFCCAVSLPIFLYLAEIGTKIFDKPSVNVARWAYIKMKGLA